MGPNALLIVRSTFLHDARVLRAAGVLRDLGYRPAVVAVMSTTERTPRTVVDGVPVLRLDPSSPFAWARRGVGRAAGREPVAADAPHRAVFAAAPSRLAIRAYRWLRTLDFYRRATGVVLRQRPALVHCNDYNTMWVGAVARLTGAAVVYDSHELWADRNLRPELRWWLVGCEALLVRCAHKVVAVSAGVAEVMARRYRIQPPAVVRNVPPTDGFSPAGRSHRSGRTLIYAGSISRHRGLEEAVAAMKELPDVTLRLMGPGRQDYIEELIALIGRLGVQSRVQLVPPVGPTQVVAALADADAGLALIQPVCLSHELAAPNKVFEYMAAGLPVLASDIAGVRSFVAEWGFGLTAHADDPADIARRVRELLEPERNRGLRAAAEHAARHVTWNAERRVLETVYREARAAACARNVRFPGQFWRSDPHRRSLLTSVVTAVAPTDRAP